MCICFIIKISGIKRSLDGVESNRTKGVVRYFDPILPSQDFHIMFSHVCSNLVGVVKEASYESNVNHVIRLEGDQGKLDLICFVPCAICLFLNPCKFSVMRVLGSLYFTRAERHCSVLIKLTGSITSFCSHLTYMKTL